MFKKITSLASISFRSGIRSYFIKEGKKFSWGMVVLMVFAFLYLAGFSIYYSKNILETLAAANQAELFVGYVLLANLMISFFQTLLTIPSQLYFSKDNNYLLPLPFAPKEILFSKFLVLWLYDLMVIIFVGFIPLAIYGIQTGAGIFFFLLAIAVMILLPIVPILLAAIIMMVLFSFLKITKHKVLFQTISTIAIILISLTISLLLQGRATANSAAYFLRGRSLVDVLRTAFPTMSFALDSLIGKNLLTILTSFTMLLASSALVILVATFVGEKFYFRGLVGAVYGSDGIKRGSVKKAAYRSKGLVVSYLVKEWATLARTPIYFTQTILPSILLPFLYVVMFGYGFFNASSTGGMSIEALRTATYYFFRNEGALRIIYLLMVGAFVFNSMYTYISITSFSREGKGAIYLKQLPILMSTQVFLKSVWNWIFAVSPMTLIIVVLTFVTQAPIWLAVIIILAGWSYAVGHSVILTLLDLRKPKIHWTSETEVIKTNLKNFLVPAYALIFIGVLVVAGFLVENTVLTVILTISCFVAVALAAILFTKKNERKLANGIR